MLGEPTSALVEAGCQGTMRVRITLRGVRAHTARPFTGRNAIHRLGPLLERVAGWEGRSVTLDGCAYAEQLQVVAIEGGVAANVVPDEAQVTLNHRYAPGPSTGGGRGLPARAARPVRGARRPGTPSRSSTSATGRRRRSTSRCCTPWCERSGAPPRAKVGWTDVASFWEHGVPAANFGPGDPLLAHHPDERVSAPALERARATLAAIIG